MHVRSNDNIRQHLDALNGMRTALLGFDKPSQLRLSSITRIYFVFAFLASEPSLLSLRLDHGPRTTDKPQTACLLIETVLLQFGQRRRNYPM